MARPFPCPDCGFLGPHAANGKSGEDRQFRCVLCGLFWDDEMMGLRVIRGAASRVDERPATSPVSRSGEYVRVRP